MKEAPWWFVCSEMTLGQNRIGEGWLRQLIVWGGDC